MARREYTAAELETMSAAERALAIEAAVVTDEAEVDQHLLERGRKRLAQRFSEPAN